MWRFSIKKIALKFETSQVTEQHKRFQHFSISQMVMNNFLLQSAESKDLHKIKSLKVKSNESLAETPRSSEDDFDSAFTENCENGKEKFSVFFLSFWWKYLAMNCVYYFQFSSLFLLSDVLVCKNTLRYSFCWVVRSCVCFFFCLMFLTFSEPKLNLIHDWFWKYF